MRISSRIRRHLADPDSAHRKIATGFLSVSLFVLLGKLAGAAKEMAVAWRYGVSETVDAFVFVFNLVNWPVAIWFSVLTVVLVPLAARLRHESPLELLRFRGELMGLTLIIGLILGVLSWVLLPALLQARWVGLSAPAVNEALEMVRGVSLLGPLGVLVSLLSAWMLTSSRHRNTLFEAIPALVLLVALLVPPWWIPNPLVWGSIAGVALHAGALATSLQRRAELHAPRFGFHSPAWRGFWGNLGIMTVGQVLMSLTSIIDQFFAVGLGTGALSSLSYANRILALIVGMGSLAISRSTLPVFSEMVGRGRTDETGSMTSFWAKQMFALGVVVTAIAWVLAPWTVELLFQRGAFKPENSLAVTALLRCFLLQLPFYFSGIVFVSFLSAQKRYSAIAWVAISNLLIKLLVLGLLTPGLGIIAIPLSSAAMYCASLLSLLVVSIRSSGHA